jgi:hypothetical protein
MKKIFKLCLCLITATFIISIFNACKPEPEPQTPGSVKVTTSSVSNITETSAKCGGTVTASGYSVGNCGLCYSELPNPTVSSYITSDLVGTGTFTSTMSGLEPGTKYYVRAYATTSSGTLYGEQKEFTTKGNNGGGDDNDDDNGGGNDGPTTGTINGHEWVDLGLPSGLKWATCNVGANSPEDYGDYYAWGETAVKMEYTENNSVTDGIQMDDISGNIKYDAASANWGSTWRMPTEQEMNDLVGFCVWTWITQDGKNGCKVTGPNGNYIFLPAAGYIKKSTLYEEYEEGFYWSSTPWGSGDTFTYHLVFSSHHPSVHSMYIGREYGACIRPVSE